MKQRATTAAATTTTTTRRRKAKNADRIPSEKQTNWSVNFTWVCFHSKLIWIIIFLHEHQKTHISIRPIMIPISSLISRFKFNFWTKNYFISKKRFLCLFCGDKVDNLCSTQSLNLDTIFLFLSLSFYLSFSLSHTFSHLLPSLDIIFRWFDLNLLLQLSTTPPRRLETMTFLSLSLSLSTSASASLSPTQSQRLSLSFSLSSRSVILFVCYGLKIRINVNVRVIRYVTPSQVSK